MMFRALIVATILAVLPEAGSIAAVSQTLAVVHIKVTLTDTARATMPVPGHALLISDNPSTRAPRRVVTAADGTADVRLPPGNYTVESDEPVAFDGKGYQWAQTVDVVAGRDLVLELTAANAEVGAAPAPSPSPAPRASAPLPILPFWKDSLVSIWTPESRASGLLVDAAGLVVTSQRVIGSATAIEVQFTSSVKVPARVLAADRTRDVAVLWIDPGAIGSVTPLPLDCADAAKPRVISGQKVVAVGGPFPGQRDASLESTVSVDDLCTVVRSAEKAKLTAPRPIATRLPVEPLEKIPAETLVAAAQRGKASLSAYQLSSADFEITFLTPVLVYGAQHNAAPANNRSLDMQQGRPIVATDFGDWSDYFADVPPVLVIRVTPKLAESFWTTVARGAAYTQGMALPPIKHFKPGFSRLRALCGDVEVTPIHPFTLEQRVSDTDGVREGLYVFDPQALGPHCKSVKLVVYSEKEPAKADTRTVDAQLIERIWQDFTLLRTPAAAAGPAGHPGFDGIWNSATATPLERPASLKDKAFFTPAEAAAWERQIAESNQEPSPQAVSRGTGTYNTVYREFGTGVVKTLRTSIVTDPADGRIPALTPAAAEVKRRRVAAIRAGASAEDLGLQDQCLAFLTAGPPMLPYSYNSNYQILQTKDAFVVHAEMIHDTRIIHLDGRSHLPPAIRLWLGDSIGQWVGDTLVVDTTNFNDGGGFYGEAGGNFGWDRNLHVVERFSLLDRDTLLYKFEIDDPTAFTQPWSGELTMARSPGPIYEYACHEGNYSLENLLRGYRASER
jgi:S1-C subfamily serine protease